MDTKSTRNNAGERRLHPVRTWLAFALAMAILLGGIAAVIPLSGELYDVRGQIERSLLSWLRFDLHETDEYWDTLFDYLHRIDAYTLESTSPSLEGEHHYDDLLAADVKRQNISYLASNSGTGITIKEGNFHLTREGLALSGGKLYIVTTNGGGTPIPGTDYSGVPAADNSRLREYMRDREIDLSTFSPESVIVLLPNARLVEGGGLLSVRASDAFLCGCVLWAIIAAIAVMLLLFLYSGLAYRSRRAADAAIGRLLGRIWIEVRLCAILFYIILACLWLDAFDSYPVLILLAVTIWFIPYCIIVDLRENGLRTFGCNIIASIAAAVKRRSARLPLHKAMARRPWRCFLLPALACALGAFICFGIASGGNGWFSIFLFFNGCYLILAILVFWVLYLKSRNEDYNDIARIMNRICEIREGRGETLILPETHRLAPYAVALESIYSGIEQAVIERTRSERTKIEMVTNISHDLKTPLTSIVGYANLLADVEGLPPEAADYVAVIMQKSARLNALIKDLFELSKATTADLPLHIEPLDLTRLLHQLLAEQADAIAAAPVTLVTELPEHECALENDGEKLYRVFANLLENALRYALDGSRIFLKLSTGRAADGSESYRVSIKNTSREYIDFTADEILSRFVRGDKNRTSEGSGLGLPIAKSFTELCGGTFRLSLDGDTFCAIVEFKKR